jgi:hypothetical protein
MTNLRKFVFTLRVTRCVTRQPAQRTVNATLDTRQPGRWRQRWGQETGGGDPHRDGLEPPRCPPGSAGLRLAPEVATARFPHRPCNIGRRHEVIRAHIKSAIRNARAYEGYGSSAGSKRETRESEADPQAKTTGPDMPSSTLTWFW